MSRGRKRPLVEAILVGTFRPDRQGRLLLEEQLPEECPLEDVSEGARQAWRNLVTAQAAYRDSGAVNPWQFASLVRFFHSAARETAKTEEFERFRLTWALNFGPWRFVQSSDGLSPGGKRRYTEKQLAAAWRWAKYQPASTNFPDWDETTWAFHRYRRRLGAVEAFRAARQESRRRRAARDAERRG
jgi:hypothetical protein